MREVQLAKFGLMTVEEAAEARGVAMKTIHRWIKSGAIAVVPVGPADGRQKFLVIAEEVKAYEPGPVGRPKVEAEKPKGKRGKT